LITLRDFHKKKLKQIKWWAWAAAVLPLSSLAGLFFIKFIGYATWFDTALIIGATTMFTIGVVWWWWAIWTMAQVTNVLGIISEKFKDVSKELKDIKKEL